MKIALFVLIILAALATLGVLIRGIVLMASGKDVTGEKQNRMMTMRVGLQAVAIVFVMLFLLLARGGD